MQLKVPVDVLTNYYILYLRHYRLSSVWAYVSQSVTVFNYSAIVSVSNNPQ